MNAKPTSPTRYVVRYWRDDCAYPHYEYLSGISLTHFFGEAKQYNLGTARRKQEELLRRARFGFNLHFLSAEIVSVTNSEDVQ